MATIDKTGQTKKSGFTIIELIVVVTIIGLMASIAIPAYTQSRQNSIVARMANDFRQYADKFELHNLSSGDWPSDGYPGTIPSGMESVLDDGSWTETTGIGGGWDYDYETFGFTAGVSVHGYTVGEDTLVAIDKLLDDGSLTSGKLRKVGDAHFSLILVE